jgi:hypothetical protein
MNKQLHTLILEICLDDFKTGQEGVEGVFDIIEKVKSAVISKGGRLRWFTYSNTPDRDHNPGGNIATLTFEVMMPYLCETKLDLMLMQPESFGDYKPKPVVLVDLKITI